MHPFPEITINKLDLITPHCHMHVVHYDNSLTTHTTSYSKFRRVTNHFILDRQDIRGSDMNTLPFVKSLYILLPLFYGLTGCIRWTNLGSDEDTQSWTERIDTLKLGQFLAMNQGDHSVVTLRDETVLRGTFVRFDTLSATEYASNYTACRRVSPEVAELPVLGDSVTLFKESTLDQRQAVIGGELVGFDANLVLLKKEGQCLIRRTGIFDIMTDTHGHEIRQDTFKRLMEAGKIPLMTTIIVDTGDREERVLTERVLQISKSSGQSTNPVIVVAAVVIAGAATYALFHDWSSRMHSSP